MGKHAFYLLGSYGAFALALIVELWLLARRHRRARRAIGHEGAVR
jgi:heme exporter protein CcmD